VLLLILLVSSVLLHGSHTVQRFIGSISVYSYERNEPSELDLLDWTVDNRLYAFASSGCAGS